MLIGTHVSCHNDIMSVVDPCFDFDPTPCLPEKPIKKACISSQITLLRLGEECFVRKHDKSQELCRPSSEDRETSLLL